MIEPEEVFYEKIRKVPSKKSHREITHSDLNKQVDLDELDNEDWETVYGTKVQKRKSKEKLRKIRIKDFE